MIRENGVKKTFYVMDTAWYFYRYKNQIVMLRELSRLFIKVLTSEKSFWMLPSFEV